MLQRYLPFIEDPHTHIHAGNGPWLQYTSMLAQYYYFTGNLEKGDKIISIIDEYASREGYLCEHLTTAERFYEFKRLEWLPGNDFDKEFALDILVPGITYDLIVEELNHMKNAYDEIDRKIMTQKDDKYLTFALPLMWSHAEYAMALMMRVESELATLQDSK
jgi:GH15 family glucan-1,4-alpha-glucosidase